MIRSKLNLPLWAVVVYFLSCCLAIPSACYRPCPSQFEKEQEDRRTKREGAAEEGGDDRKKGGGGDKGTENEKKTTTNKKSPDVTFVRGASCHIRLVAISSVCTYRSLLHLINFGVSLVNLDSIPRSTA